MSKIRVYINTFDELGSYSGFQEVTNDIDARSNIKISQKLDGSEYDVGIFKNTNTKITLRNDHGLYSEPEVQQSIFTNKRIDSLVKVTWASGDEAPICGIAICGEAVLGSEENLFYGLLNDVASKQDIDDQRISFSVQGLESIFDRVETNYSDLSVSDNISTTIYKLLNQSAITSLMTIDALNISVSLDQVLDDISELEETTVKEALDLLLNAGNAVLYVDVGTQIVYVKAREIDDASCFTFYGQASNNGIENIVDLRNVRTGLNRTFNFIKWEDTTLTAKDATSTARNGVRKKEFKNDLLTNNTKRQNLLDNIRDEFANPKQELNITTYLDYDSLGVFLLDCVNIDYPTVFEPALGSNLPLYGSDIYGEARYPLGQWSLTITPDVDYKVTGRSINLKNETIEYEVREA